MGPLRVLESFSDHIARSERRLVVTITSCMGSLADNKSGSSIAYRSSKAAVNMVMRSAAIDLAPRGITCVLVNPGWVRTDMGGPKAPLSPQESVTAMRRNQSGKFYNYDGREYREATDTRTMGAVTTGLREKLNQFPPCRNGNWKIASRDSRPPA
jgi:NAD(P)-dependent dehydrogenase (short-subunit alcohol dehydrogenase family)